MMGKKRLTGENQLILCIVVLLGVIHIAIQFSGSYLSLLGSIDQNDVTRSWMIRIAAVLSGLVFIRFHGKHLIRSGAGPFPPVSLLLCLGLLAWDNRFIQDDAFISFRYASNFVRGIGLTWNAGEPPIEGYTNFLWTLLMTVPIRWKLDPVGFSYLAGIASYICSLIVTYKLSGWFSGSSRAAMLTVIFLGLNHTFSSYATGGLETQFQTALLISLFWFLVRMDLTAPGSIRNLLLISVFMTLPVLTRLDSALPVGVLIGAFCLQLFKSGPDNVWKIRHVAALLVPAAVIGTCYCLWKLNYYGNVLPNTFYSKASNDTSLVSGVSYIAMFMTSYGLYPFGVLCLFMYRHFNRVRWGRPIILSVIIWIAYVIKVGGCFMEFRFLVPVMPLIAVLIVEAISKTVSVRAQAAIIIGLSVVSFNHRLTFAGRDGIESFRELEGHFLEDHWDELGVMLGELFGNQNPEVTIATSAAGAIPYYSGLKTVDMRGLNDPWIARHGTIIGDRPGHQRAPTPEYLIRRGVHIVIGHPRFFIHPKENSMVNLSYLMSRITNFDIPGLSVSNMPPNARVIEIPYDPAQSLYVLYWLPHPSIDRIIQEKGFKTYRFN